MAGETVISGSGMDQRQEVERLTKVCNDACMRMAVFVKNGGRKLNLQNDLFSSTDA